MSDLINRQAAIEYIKLQKWRRFDGMTIEEAILTMIREVPSAQPEPKWIPATKRLPKIGEEVLLSEPNAMFIAEYHGSGNAEGLWVVDECHHYLADVNKCAWMPLPKGYRGKQDENR